MGVTGLDHLNIRTRDIAGSAAFFVRVLGMTREAPAGVTPPAQANWLFDEAGRPIIHLRLRDAQGTATGAVDHVALRCTGKDAMIARLEAEKHPFDAFADLTPGMTQIFLTDPHGVTLELVFVGE